MDINHLRAEVKPVIIDGFAAVCRELNSRIPYLRTQYECSWNDAFCIRATAGLYFKDIELVISFDALNLREGGVEVSGDIMIEQGPILKDIVNRTFADSTHVEADIVEQARFFVRECQASIDFLESELLK